MLPAMTELAIEVSGLHKSYKDVKAVRGIDLQVSKGEVFALLGPNGAGKTTAVEILEGYRRRDAGDVSVLGYDPAAGARRFKQRIGIVLQDTGIDPYLTVEETINRYRGFYPTPRPLDEIIEVVELQEKRTARANKLSGGQQRRLDVAIGLAGDPELLFLDEPTTGFDPSARRNAWAMIKNLQSLGKTILLTTHYMDEAQNLADRVAIIVHGRIITQGPPSALVGREASKSRISFRVPEDAPRPPEAIIRSEPHAGGFYEITPPDPVRALHELTGWALDNNIELEELNVTPPSLEDVYLNLTRAAEDQHTLEVEASAR
jgi:ABC-2 type transport system ATP-binding protein